MARNPKSRPDDARGNKPSGVDAPGGQRRAGTELEGKRGNAPHERDEEAATIIKELSGYGMPQDEISRILNATYGGGFSVDTLDRHYRDELDHGLSLAKEKLLKRAHEMAMMEKVPAGVSPDKAFEISSRKVDFLLNVVHRVRPGTVTEFDGSAINVTISGDDAEL